MLFRNVTILILYILLSSACSTNHTLSAYHHTYLSFGSMGGITAQYSEYRLLPNGQLFKRQKHLGAFAKQKNLTSRQAKQFFKITHGFLAEEYQINDPGNISYFIIWRNKEEEKLELVWGKNEREIDKRIQMLYSNLTKMSEDLVYIR